MKSSRAAVREGGLLQIVWPDQEAQQSQQQHVSLDQLMPWQPIDIDKLGPFCKLKRSHEDDVSDLLLEVDHFSRDCSFWSFSFAGFSFHLRFCEPYHLVPSWEA
eukprot:Polyplicarium_translucidae@DN4548_c0_g1_i1.p4